MSDARCQALSGIHRTDEEASLQQRVQGEGGEDGQDNTHMESFFYTMKIEWIRGRTFATFTELEAALKAYIRFYNHCLHPGIDYHTPEEYEKLVVRSRVHFFGGGPQEQQCLSSACCGL